MIIKQRINKKWIAFFVALGLITTMAGCSQTVNVIASSPIAAATSNNEATNLTTTIPPQSTPVSNPPPLTLDVTPTQDLLQAGKIWISPDIPIKIREQIQIPNFLQTAAYELSSNLKIDILNQPANQANDVSLSWVYVLVAPFPTVIDGVSFTELLNAWKGQDIEVFDGKPILMSQETYTAFSRVWGQADEGRVQILESDQLSSGAWADMPSWAILPFEELAPRWKVLKIDGISPIDDNFDVNAYPLTLEIGLSGDAPIIEALNAAIGTISEIFPQSNYLPEKMTSLILTGTTALVRYTALKMEENGVLYPAGDIVNWLRDADLTHISNEVPFDPECPPADPVRVEQRFCSDPSYFQLLTYIGADIIELTGNHILDWGPEPLLYTLDLYNQNNLPYYGGGVNLEEAREPLLIENHGNKLAFIGCSPAGPENVWATATSPGSASCDFDLIQEQITSLLSQGYLPIFTFQHLEVEDFKPHSSQRVDFQRVANMGAVIVSGSQSHFPQAMTFIGDHFVHYGLGNLFFDQMYGYNPHEFIDRHIFYAGRYISTELLSAMLEDYARPRPMTADERAEFLTQIFSNSSWD